MIARLDTGTMTEYRKAMHVWPFYTGAALFALVLTLGGCAPTSLRPPAVAGHNSATPARSPLPLVHYAGWSHSVHLTNAALDVVIVPALGRIVHLAPPGHASLLNQNPDLRGQKVKRGTRFANAGGDWLWPVAQSHWKHLGEGDWPPPAALAEGPWQAESWRNADGSQSCFLQRRYKAPLNLVVTRLITLERDQPRVRILQRAVSTGTRPVPITLWNIAQVRSPSRVFLPSDPSGGTGIRSLNFATPPPSQLLRFGDVLVFTPTAAGEFKFGSGATRAWVAAQVGDHVLLQESLHRLTGPLPDGGCSIEIYANSGLGYVEIETLTPEKRLESGDAVENTLLLECLPITKRLSHAAAANRVLDVVQGTAAP